MTESTNRPNPPRDIDAVKLQPEISPINLQIDPAEAGISVLTPSAARAITPGENAAEFVALVKVVTKFWQPKDVFEQLLMADFVYAEWELRRLRRLGQRFLDLTH